MWDNCYSSSVLPPPKPLCGMQTQLCAQRDNASGLAAQQAAALEEAATDIAEQAILVRSLQGQVRSLALCPRMWSAHNIVCQGSPCQRGPPGLLQQRLARTQSGVCVCWVSAVSK